jgi:hypothetical protein
MAHNRPKKNLAELLLFTITLLTAIMLTAPIAMAVPTCTDLNSTTGATKDWIVTILEEQIGTPNKETTKTAETAVAGTQEAIIDCIRVTKSDSSSGQLTSVYQNAEGTCPANAVCQRVQVFFAKSGTGLLFMYIGLVYRWAAGVIGTISVLYLVWGGVDIATAGDNTGKIDTAKTHIFQSLGGLALLFLSAVILYTINPNFFTL